MNFRKILIQGMTLGVVGVFALLIPEVREVRAEIEDVQVLERKPDESNPAYEIIKVEGGLIFRAPKDMTFVKQDGVIAPISTEEYCLRKFGGVEKQVEVLTKRIDVLEGKAGIVPERRDQESL